MDYVDYLEKTGRLMRSTTILRAGGYIAAADTSFTVKKTSSNPN